ncbi:GTP-binding protein [Metallosphaera tengchongensis]|uniref:polynucleotide 5'-hydroxyl-kinase n=1 Tax=Metallosphaera tengchongensis TaxID=1532350 RepID=A0A6N0NTY6_9CREN|nr:Clp1/GlmU family protein [Metallosphaera tengchongensis]QKQ99596.1 GTP-binding protein [Metallosphaera tengchongensis]
MMVSRDQDLILRGPCKLRVLKGDVQILGLKSLEYEIKGPSTFTVHSEDRGEVEGDCKVVAKVKSLGWDGLAEVVAETGGRVLVIGGSDSGKTYLSKLIYNIAEGFSFVDLDVGQSSLFLPAFISKFGGGKLWLDNELNFTQAEFFGDISPSRYPQRHLDLSVKLAWDNNLIVDTDGWISKSGFKHKVKLIEILEPEYILVMDNELLNRMPEEYQDRIVLVRKVPLDLQKTREARIKNRQALYKRYFSKSSLVSVSLDGRRTGMRSPFCYPAHLLNGLLVGLLKEDKIVGAGLMRIAEDTKIMTPLESFDDYILGFVSITEEGNEIRL